MYESEREAMVQRQLKARGIIDEGVLAAMLKVERHRFVGSSDEIHAYEDRPVFIGSGQTISQPFIVALMTQTLDLSGDDRVLEIGTGSGYQTAILAEIARNVHTVERLQDLYIRAQKVLTKLGYGNISFKLGDGTLGWDEHAPYTRILVTAAAPQIPKSLFEQLTPEGRMVVPVGGRFSQQLNLVIKTPEGKMQVMRRGGCVFVPLVGEGGWHND